MRTCPSLEQAGNKPPQSAGDEAGEQGQGQLDEASQSVQGKTHEPGRETAGDDLTLAPNVEKTSSEPEGDRETCEDQRRSRDQRFRKRVESGGGCFHVAAAELAEKG